MFRKTAAITLISVMALAACGRDRGAVPADSTLSGDPGAAACTVDPLLQAGMIDAVNAARVGQGKTVLKVDDRLNAIAQSHACDVAASGQASVIGSDGRGIVDRARAVRYPTCGVAQLVSVGGSASGAVGQWLASVPHREQVLAQTPDEIGAGVARGPDGLLRWSLVLGNDCR